ncbi:MAG: hypothetical protein R2695_07425 [Acidimicrobiales bacterium]
MTSTVSKTHLLDGPRRGIFITIVFVVLVLITVDGVLTWIRADDARDVIDAVVAADHDRYPTGLDDHGLLLSDSDKATVARNTDGHQLERHRVNTKTWLAVIGLIAAVALTIASGPGSSRNVLAATIVVAAAAFFVPLVFYAETIDQVTTAHGL